MNKTIYSLSTDGLVVTQETVTSDGKVLNAQAFTKAQLNTQITSLQSQIEMLTARITDIQTNALSLFKA